MSQVLADLGDSINLMPYSLYEKLELGELTSTRMSLSLANRSFVVLDMEADERVPIIHGLYFCERLRPLLMYMTRSRITLRVGNENVTYDVSRSMKHPSDHDDFSDPCHSVYLLSSFISGFDTCLDYICGADLVGVGIAEELMG
ncbi:uncharacterized protein LOC143577863 [Bidens hawaiensis]|uniref:uncharacterized protein LOC143577863 n=1 Tax=Bidens hawaiensis TaxID=980011 RepID=UPI00404B7A03